MMRTQTNIHGVTVEGDFRKLCCKKPENLSDLKRLSEDIWYRQCRECGCKHYEATAEPGRLRFLGER